MEREAPKVANRPQGTPAVAGHDRLGGVFDHAQAVAPGDVHDGVHLAGDPAVVHDADGPRAFGYGLLDLGLVDVHGIRADVDEDELCAGQDERVGGGGEGVAGQDDLVARFDAAHERGHLECRGPAGGEQALRGAEPVLDPAAAELGEGSVAAELAVDHGLGHMVELCAVAGRDVERDHDGAFSLRNTGARRARSYHSGLYDESGPFHAIHRES